jgi:hypothetical protein
MVDLIPGPDGVYMAEGHDHAEDDLRAGLKAALAATRNATQAEAHADMAGLSEAWYSEEHGFGHDCSLHADTQSSPGCGTFGPVTIATGIPAPVGVQRAKPAPEKARVR